MNFVERVKIASGNLENHKILLIGPMKDEDWSWTLWADLKIILSFLAAWLARQKISVK